MAVGWMGAAAVFLAIASYGISAVAWIAQPRSRVAGRIGAVAFWLGAAFVAAAFICLVVLLLGKQYQFQYVWTQTENDMPFAYRFSAAWSSQEGSFLLWALTAAVIAAIAARATGAYRRWFTVVASLVLVAVVAILAYESPFSWTEIHEDLRVMLPAGQELVMPPDGLGMNPTLMNYWMVIHPWVIFIGFGSLLTLFSWSASAALSRDWKSWIPAIRPWAIFSMAVLGVGVTMGGLWAYETLGWGGFWAWDPVENVSLVPFLATVALTHGLYMGARGRWGALSLILGLLPFAWFVYGTYLTRSGALVNVSVHSFAEMNHGAHKVLLGLVIAVLLFLVGMSVLIFLRRSRVEGPPVKPAGHRGSGLGVGMAMIYGVAIMAAVGMSVPFFGGVYNALFTEPGGLFFNADLAAKEVQVVEQSDYNRQVVWLFFPALLLMAAAPFLGWTKTAGARFGALVNAFFISVILFGAAVIGLVRGGLTMTTDGRMPTAQLVLFFGLVWVCMFSVSANGLRLWERLRARSGGLGPFLMHAGISLLMLGLITSAAFQKQDASSLTRLQPGLLQLMPGQSYIVTLEGLPESEEQLLDRSNRLNFTLTSTESGRKVSLHPNFYFDEGREMWVNRPAINRMPLYDLYLTVEGFEIPTTELSLKPGETQTEDGYTVKYVAQTQAGEPGQPGTRFGAQLVVTVNGEEFEANPEIEISSSGIIKHNAMIAGDIVVELVRLDAADGTASLSLVSDPVFRVQLFLTPLTMLVWLGAGMMACGGLFAVGKRRRLAHDQPSASDALEQTPEVKSAPRTRDLLKPGVRR